MPNRAFPIVTKLGGPDTVIAKLRSAGLQRSKDALRMATARASLPAAFMRALMAAADAEGIAYTARDFAIEPATEPPAAPERASR